jgi:hypothetical protein
MGDIFNSLINGLRSLRGQIQRLVTGYAEILP